MKSQQRIYLCVTVFTLGMVLLERPVAAQDFRSAVTTVALYVDRSTKQVFLEPGPNRTLMRILAPVDTKAMAAQVEQRVSDQTHQEILNALAESQARQAAQQQALAQQVAAMKPAWSSYLTNFQDKFRLGVLAYLNWGAWTHTGYGPYFLDNLNTPGIGNNFYNSFDLNRLYLNAYFTPRPDLTLRVTPEVYRTWGTVPASRVGTSGAVNSNLTGDLNLRIKYAYVQYTGWFDDIAALKGTAITLGAQQNPLVPWEDDFGQFRYVYFSPWNYLGLSSSQIGLTLQGPIKLYGGEATYVDYDFGIFDSGNFNNAEQADTKQVMGRLTLYPLGARWRYDGLGVTGFYDYGWGNVAPNSNSLSTPLKGTHSHFSRMAALVHYAAEQWNILGEFDYGENAFQLANLYTGVGPADAFGTATGTAFTAGTHFGNSCSTTTPCYPVFGTYGPQVAAYSAFLNNGRAREIGLDFLGHYHIPHTKLTLFGIFQWFMPNEEVPEDPLDFQRFVVGISYQVNEYLRIALDSQNLLFYHHQFGLPVNVLRRFNYVPGSKLNGQLLPGNRVIPASLNTIIPNLVPRDTHALFLNLEFAY
jgi:hypothetical protein